MPTEILGITLSDEQLRLLTTVLVIAGILILYRGIYASGGWLKRRFSDHAVEAAQGLVATVISVAGLGYILNIWATSDEVFGSGGSGFSFPETASIQIVLTLGIFVGAYLLTRVSKSFIQAIFEGDRVSVHQREIGHHIVQVTVYSVAGLVVLTLWQVPLERLLLGAGAATIVLGLAARQSVGAVLAGFVLLFSRPFEIGDWVVVEDQEGIVRDVNIVKTQLETFDSEQVMIPNDKVTGADIVNRSRDGDLRVTSELRLPYEADVRHAVDVAEEALQALDADPVVDGKDPQVLVKRLDEDAIVLTLRVWINDPSPGRALTAKTAVTDAVTARFADEGIEIPVPQLEVGSRDDAGGVPVSANSVEATATGGGPTPESLDVDDAEAETPPADDRQAR